MTDIVQILAKELNIRYSQAQAAVELMDEGNTIPFIARYRKEATGSLEDEVLRHLEERLRYLRNLEEKKEQVRSTIGEQGKLTRELEAAIAEAKTLVALEDLYRPYRPKRKTRASAAMEKGLEPLARDIFQESLNQDPLEEAQKYLSSQEGKEVATPQEALEGAKDIVAEWISDDASFRSSIRSKILEQGILTAKAREKDAASVYENYYDFAASVKKAAGYQILAINRGESEKILTVGIDAPQEEIYLYLKKRVIRKNNPHTRGVLEEALLDSYKRLMGPALEREIRSFLTEKAQEEAIRVFGKNLYQLLMQPPIPGRVVLGWDPGFRTGCKLAVVDETGKLLDTAVVFPTAPQNKVEETKKKVKKWIQTYGISLISLGNGTASRESEGVIAQIIKETDAPVEYMIVSEAGASVYSASEAAGEEMPEYDVGQRSSASIARRLQDPLAELVKIDPRSIGVGQYQHDMNQKRLSEALENVVEDCVNRVGVDLNTASAALLSHISGISKTLAKNIVAYREQTGSFASRKELKKVPKLGPKAFEQCGGFLRITGGSEPLDATSVHPESYAATEQLLKKLKVEKKQLALGGIPGLSKGISDYGALAAELNMGEITLRDIVKELEKPGRDPRETLEKPLLRRDVLEIEDLKEGMELKGTVRNVIDFGAFVDIGVHQDGLVHISKMKKGFVRHPLEVVSVGDIVDVKVISVDPVKKRIALSMI